MIDDGKDSPPPVNAVPPAPSAAPEPAARPAASGASSGGGKLLLIFLLILIAFAGGITATLWGPKWLQSHSSSATPQSAAALGNQAMPATPLTPATLTGLEGRVAALSARMDELNTEAQSAGLYATRAESIMVAFATRRALDSGTPLGYLESELKARFGDAQPKAVATIISAARDPVTLMDLQAGLMILSPQLTGAAGKGDWWTATKRELANLIIIRKSNAPSPAPRKAMDDARALLAMGKVDEALAAIEEIPSHGDADAWIERARRYNEAHRALDVIDAAAILEPRDMVRPMDLQTPALAPAATFPAAPPAQVEPPVVTGTGKGTRTGSTAG